MLMIILVCGGRHYNGPVGEKLEQLNDTRLIIEGGASGADYLAKQWAKLRGIHYAEVPALWDYYRKGAGPVRNSAMLLLRPDLCVAFPGGSGTADMVQKCINENIPIWRPCAPTTTMEHT